MDNQEIFDKVVAHARKQNCKAINSETAECRYRTDDGRKCFIGALIPDELYDSKIEGLAVAFLPRTLEILGARSNRIDINSVLYSLGIQNEQMTFCSDLQKIHDRCSIDKWELSFIDIAWKYNLVYTKPDQVEITQ
jgi:hypothetical protein